MINVGSLEFTPAEESIEDVLKTYKRGVNADEVFARIYPKVVASSEKVYFKYGLTRKMEQSDFMSFMLETLYKCIDKFDESKQTTFMTFYISCLRNRVLFEAKKIFRRNKRIVPFSKVEMYLSEDETIEDHLELVEPEKENNSMTEQELIDFFDTEDEQKIVAFILKTGRVPSRRNKENYKLGMLQYEFIVAMRGVREQCNLLKELVR